MRFKRANTDCRNKDHPVSGTQPDSSLRLGQRNPVSQIPEGKRRSFRASAEVNDLAEFSDCKRYRKDVRGKDPKNIRIPKVAGLTENVSEK
jgi:hypothetical protein